MKQLMTFRKDVRNILDSNCPRFGSGIPFYKKLSGEIFRFVTFGKSTLEADLNRGFSGIADLDFNFNKINVGGRFKYYRFNPGLLISENLWVIPFEFT